MAGRSFLLDDNQIRIPLFASTASTPVYDVILKQAANMSRQSTCGIESHLSLADRPDLRPCSPCTGLVHGGCHPFQPLERRDKVLSTHMSCLTSRPSLGFQHEYGSRLRQTILSTDKRIKTSDKKFRDDWLSFNGESSCYQMKIFGELNMWLFSLRFYLFWEINQII